MSTVNSTSLPATSVPVSLIWMPYVLIAVTFITFPGVNFWRYHKRNRRKYLRKPEENRLKEGLHERRRIVALTRSHFLPITPSVESIKAITPDITMVSGAIKEDDTTSKTNRTVYHAAGEGDKNSRAIDTDDIAYNGRHSRFEGVSTPQAGDTALQTEGHRCNATSSASANLPDCSQLKEFTKQSFFKEKATINWVCFNWKHKISTIP